MIEVAKLVDQWEKIHHLSLREPLPYVPAGPVRAARQILDHVARLPSELKQFLDRLPGSCLYMLRFDRLDSGEEAWSQLRQWKYRALTTAPVDDLRFIAGLPVEAMEKIVQEAIALAAERERAATLEQNRVRREKRRSAALLAVDEWKEEHSFWLDHDAPDVRTDGKRDILDALATGSGIGALLDERSLFIHGRPQCGKTTAIWQHVARLVSAHPLSYFHPATDDDADDADDETAAELFAGHRVSFLFSEAGEVLERIARAGRDGDRQAEIEKLAEPELVILDDLGQSATPAQLASLLRLLKARWERPDHGRLIISSNYSPSELLKHWSQHGQVASAILGRIESARRKGLLSVVNISPEEADL